MSKICMRLTVLILVLATLLVGCSKDETATDTQTGTNAPKTQDTEPVNNTKHGDIALLENGKSVYSAVVYSAQASETETDKVAEIYTCLRELTASVQYKADDNYNPDTKEIVVALSSAYPEVAPLQEKLKYKDYVIAVSGNKLVITARTLEALGDATDKFIRMVTSSGEKKVENLYVSTTNFEANYRVKDFTISGNDIQNYKIVYPKVTEKGQIDYYEAAVMWQSIVGNACGHILPIVDDSTAETDTEIVVGKTSRSVSKYVAPLHYEVSVNGSKLAVNCGGIYSNEKLESAFKKEFITGKTSVALDESSDLSGNFLTQPVLARSNDTDIRVIAANILCEGVNWNSTGKILPVAPRLEIFLANIYAYKPDAIAINEASALWISQLKAHISDDYEVILNRVTTNDGKEADNYSAMIYNKSTLRLRDGSYGVQPYSVNDGSIWCRNMAYAVFDVIATGKEFAFISTHWNVQFQSKEQPEELNEKIIELSNGGTRAVIAGGDMNSRYNGESYMQMMNYGTVNNLKFITSNLVNDIGTMKDIWKPANNDPTRTLDHLFATKNVQCTMFMTMVENATIDMSDHNGIMADVKF